MLKSMTGFGFGRSKNYVVEIRSLNHRYCDIFVKLPNYMYKIENVIKSAVRDHINRGKIEVNIEEDGKSYKLLGLNEDFAKKYYKIASTLRKKLNLK